MGMMPAAADHDESSDNGVGHDSDADTQFFFVDDVTVTVEDAEADQGESVSVGLDAAPGDGLQGWLLDYRIDWYELTVEYDPAALEFEGVADGDVGPVSVVEQEPGVVTIEHQFEDGSDNAPVSLADLEFTAVGEGDTEVSVSDDSEIGYGFEIAHWVTELPYTAGFESGIVSIDGEPVETGTLEVLVTDQDGEPLEGASVSGDGIDETTDADGLVSVETDVGEYDLTVEYEGQIQELETEVEADTTTAEEVTFDLDEEDGTIEVSVIDQFGEPVEGASVSGDGIDETTDANGEVSVAVEPGTYDLTVEADDESEEVTVEVEAGETESVQVELPVAEPETGTLDLTVVDQFDEPIEGASVTGDGVDETTDADGDISVELETGVYDLTVAADGESEDITVEIEADETTERVVELPVAEPPVEGFEAVNEGGFIAFNETTEEDAREEGLEFPEDGIEITGDVDGDTWESTAVDFPTLEPVPGIFAEVAVPEGLSGEIDFANEEMTAEGELEVTVLTEEEPSFSFEIAATTGESGALEGDASFDEDGGEVLLVDNEFIVDDRTGDGIVDAALGLPIEEPGLAWLELPMHLDFVDEIEEDGTLDLTVTDQDGQPLEGASVAGDGVDETTNADGQVSVDLAPGTYDLEISYEGSSESITVDIEEDETTSESVELEMEDTGVLELTVTDQDGEPLDGASVSGDGVDETTDADGELSVELEEGTYDLTVDYEGASESLTAEIEAGETTSESVTLEIDKTGDLELSVTDQDGEPLEGAAVEGDGVDETTGADGEVSVELEEGTYDLTVEYEGASESLTVEIEAGEITSESVTFDVGPDIDAFESVNDEGFLGIAYDSEEEAAEEGFQFPDGEIEIDGDVDLVAGTWESTTVDFPMLEYDAGLITADIYIEVPDGLSGEFDLEDEVMTSEGTMEVEIHVAGDIEEIEVDIEATTGESGEMVGEASFDEDSGYAELVDNDFYVPETGNSILDEAVGLPAEEGESWLSLPLEIEFEE